jgi:hypothetical protein
MEGTLPLTEQTLSQFTGSEMERGLLEQLMCAPDAAATLKRNNSRRRSVKANGANASQLKRSRTRENNVYVVEEEV